MSRFALYIASLLVAAANAEYFNTYKNNEMAPYEVADWSIGKSYEIRLYSPQKWVTTRMRTPSKGYGGNAMFMKLYRYITGANDAETDIKMTSPVLTKVDDFRRSYEYSFYLPTIFQKDPPEPMAEDVYIKEIGPMVVYVKSYSGWSSDRIRSQKYEELKQELRKDDRSFDTTFYYSAGYNSPMDYRNRRNEIWVVAAK